MAGTSPVYNKRMQRALDFEGDDVPVLPKVKNVDYPDKLRQARISNAISEFFARSYHNHLGLGVNLRSAQGKESAGLLVV
ncbi:hypothetical protein [Mycobacterium uberis]|uniref:hypothetical protein n=1 Tax=Mycobacterium uberis TaxID=2162698 RepID=UPI000E305B49|nr:hypothetical protein [Mycobacterium uberis]